MAKKESLKENLRESLTRDAFNNSNLIRLLKTFSKAEIREFGKFARSPFHNNRIEAARFYDAVKKFHPAFEHNNFSKEKIYAGLYPNTRYRDDVIRRLSSNVFRLGEEFASYNVFRKNEFNYERSLLEYYLTKFSDNLFQKQKKKTEAYLEAQPRRDAKYHLNVNFTEELKRVFNVKSDPLGKNIDIQKQINSVWNYSAITLLRLYKTLLESSKQSNRKYDAADLGRLLKLIDKSGFTKSKALEIWYALCRFFTSDMNRDTFYLIKDLLEKNPGILDDEENFIIHVSLLGYCYDMNLIPGQSFHTEECQIIKQMLGKGLLTEEGVIYSEWFMYAFITSVRAGEIRAAEKLIEAYREKIPKKERNNVLNHAYAELAFEKKDFNDALEFLAIPNYNNIGEKLRANHMYVKIYYELGLTEQFFPAVDSFKHMMKYDTSLNKQTKDIRKNFINYTAKLYKLRLNETDLPLEELKKQVMGSKIMGNKWLLEKIDEYEKSLE